MNDLDDLNMLQRVESIVDIEALPAETEHVLVSHLDDEKLKALGRLSKLRSIIQDGSPQVTDAGLQFLSHLRELERLDLEWSERISDNGLFYLYDLVRLRWLDLGFCSGVTAKGVRKLKEALRYCEIIGHTDG